MRIALVATYILTGGTETWIRWLGSYLVRAGYQVDVVTLVEAGELFDDLATLGLRGYHIAGHGSSAPLVHTFRVGRRLAHRRYDVVFLNTAAYAQLALPMLDDSTAAVVVLHGTNPGIFHIASMGRDAWNVAVAISPAVFKAAHSQLRGRPIVQIRHGVETPSEEAWQRRTPFCKPLRLVYVGRLVEDKGVRQLPAIVKGCVALGLDVTLDVIGWGPLEGELTNSIKSFGLSDRMRLLGRIAPAEVRSSLLDYHIMLLPSLHEGLSLVVLEAQAGGCVPVASRLEGATDVAISHGRTGTLVPKGDTAGFIQAVVDLYRSPSQWQAMSTAGREYVLREFSAEACGQAYLDLIDQLRQGAYPLPVPRISLPPIDPRLIPWGRWEASLSRWQAKRLQRLSDS